MIIYGIVLRGFGFDFRVGPLENNLVMVAFEDVVVYDIFYVG